MKKQGGFVPGIRPGKPTQECLGKGIKLPCIPRSSRTDHCCADSDLLQWRVRCAGILRAETSVLVLVGVMPARSLKQIESQMLVRNYEATLVRLRSVLRFLEGSGNRNRAIRVPESVPSLPEAGLLRI